MSITTLPSSEKDIFKIVAMLNQLAQGRSNAAGECTLDDGVTSTTVAAPSCGAGAQVILFPKTADAAAELGAGTIYIQAADVTAGQFIITHANDPSTDRVYSFLCIG